MKIIFVQKLYEIQGIEGLEGLEGLEGSGDWATKRKK